MSDRKTPLPTKTREAGQITSGAPEKALPEPSARESTAIAKATANVQARAPRLAAKVVRKDAGRIETGSDHADTQGWAARLFDAFGTASGNFVQAELGRMALALGATGADAEQRINAGLAVLDGVRPRDEIETMLVTQMVVTHAAAIDYLTRTKKAELTQQAEFTGRLACKLLRAFTLQTEALAKLRRGGEQVVRVEHVNVYGGGQAIVGTINRGGGLTKTDEQAQTPISAVDPSSPALRSPDSERAPCRSPTTGAASQGRRSIVRRANHPARCGIFFFGGIVLARRPADARSRNTSRPRGSRWTKLVKQLPERWVELICYLNEQERREERARQRKAQSRQRN